MVSSTTSILSELGNSTFSGGGHKYAVLNAAADGTREVVAAVTGSKIRVLALVADQQADAAATMQFKSATTAIMGELVSANTKMLVVLPFSSAGWFETSAGEALQVTTAGTDVTGCLVYDEVAG
ncbi:hypothetical protein CMI37_16170 [Candidatus Pacearchaeota archaeon]|nr:hypothetical protein [Candidatus Pacearchaeota archaeon]